MGNGVVITGWDFTSSHICHNGVYDVIGIASAIYINSYVTQHCRPVYQEVHYQYQYDVCTMWPQITLLPSCSSMQKMVCFIHALGVEGLNSVQKNELAAAEQKDS